MTQRRTVSRKSTQSYWADRVSQCQGVMLWCQLVIFQELQRKKRKWHVSGFFTFSLKVCFWNMFLWESVLAKWHKIEFLQVMDTFYISTILRIKRSLMDLLINIDPKDCMTFFSLIKITFIPLRQQGWFSVRVSVWVCQSLYSIVA